MPGLHAWLTPFTKATPPNNSSVSGPRVRVGAVEALIMHRGPLLYGTAGATHGAGTSGRHGATGVSSSPLSSAKNCSVHSKSVNGIDGEHGS